VSDTWIAVYVVVAIVILVGCLIAVAIYRKRTYGKIFPCGD